MFDGQKYRKIEGNQPKHFLKLFHSLFKSCYIFYFLKKDDGIYSKNHDDAGFVRYNFDGKDGVVIAR